MSATGSQATIDDLGVLVRADEMRTAAVCVDRAGSARLVVAARGWVLVVDPVTGEQRQLTWPHRTGDFPFASMATGEGVFWTGAGTHLVEVDPFALTVRVHQPCPEEEITGFAFAEGPDGTVWATTYPHCRLVAFDPGSRTFTEGPRLSESQSYVAHLAVDRHGWLYAGVGTQHRDLVAVSPAGERRSLAQRSQQGKGSGFVHLGTDGQVYGHIDAEELWSSPDGHDWTRLDGFDAVPVDEASVAPSDYTGQGFGRIHHPRPAPWRVTELGLADRHLVVELGDGTQVTTALDYESEGAELSPFTALPDGGLIGTSNHPLRLYQFDPVRSRMVDHGREPVAQAGGNICAWARQGDVLLGPAYAGGHLYRFNPAVAVEAGVNPYRIAEVPAAYRPRCAVPHPDGRHVLWGGYGGYGDAGGALVVHQLDDEGAGTHRVVDHSAIAPNHSPIAVGLLPGGDVVVGTCVETPGGATSDERTAVVVRLSWPDLAVRDRWTPALEVRSWAGLAVAPDGTVHLVSRDGLHVHLDLETGQVLDRHDWRSGGALALGGVVITPDHAHVLQARTVWRIDLRDHRTTSVADGVGPITVGGALVGPDLYVGSGPRLLRVRDAAATAGRDDGRMLG